MTNLIPILFNYSSLFLAILHLSTFLTKKQLKFTSHEIQNELLSIMAQHILRQIARNLQSSYYAIMADEVTDVSNCEQVAIVICWVDDSLMPHDSTKPNPSHLNHW